VEKIKEENKKVIDNLIKEWKDGKLKQLNNSKLVVKKTDTSKKYVL